MSTFSTDYTNIIARRDLLCESHRTSRRWVGYRKTKVDVFSSLSVEFMRTTDGHGAAAGDTV